MPEEAHTKSNPRPWSNHDGDKVSQNVAQARIDRQYWYTLKHLQRIHAVSNTFAYLPPIFQAWERAQYVKCLQSKASLYGMLTRCVAMPQYLHTDAGNSQLFLNVMYFTGLAGCS